MGKPGNVVVVVVDGLRPDHLGLYGYGRRTSPWLDEQARRGVVCAQAVSQSNWTFPSFFSFLTSQDPTRNGVFHVNARLAPPVIPLAEGLRQSGYRTAAFVGGPYLDAQFGLDRGFEAYRAGKNMSFRDFKDILPLACDWLERRRGEKFFLLLHDNDLHPPFDIADALPEAVGHAFGQGGPLDALMPDYYFVRAYNRYPWESFWGPPPSPDYLARVDAIRNDPRELKHIVAHYDAQILAADRFLERLWKRLEALGLLEDTVVVLTSDHGMEWGERGLIATAFHEALWDSLVRVPLVFWHPSLRPGTLSGGVELIDLAPTLMDLLGLRCPSSFQGRSLAPLLGAADADRGPDDRPAFSAASTLQVRESLRLFSLRTGRWKLIYDAERGSVRLFDLREDPGELLDVSAQQAEVARGMLGALRRRAGLSGS
ncbi:MAG: sulfatase-like hydrolase/transferase [Elusimicrobia bacterium]|nr:sulfatase-like hydrolase/transferase [Elusimicrobiota bacterium]